MGRLRLTTLWAGRIWGSGWSSSPLGDSSSSLGPPHMTSVSPALSPALWAGLPCPPLPALLTQPLRKGTQRGDGLRPQSRRTAQGSRHWPRPPGAAWGALPPTRPRGLQLRGQPAPPPAYACSLQPPAPRACRLLSPESLGQSWQGTLKVQDDHRAGPERTCPVVSNLRVCREKVTTHFQRLSGTRHSGVGCGHQAVP